jgi:hypothetical protein
MHDATCPLDGTTFRAFVAESGSRFGGHLDMKPYGPIAAPLPLPRCPTDGLVLYKAEFSAGEITKLKPFVASPEYQVLLIGHKDYYLATRLMRHLGDSEEQIAWTLLRATWQTYANPILYQRYALEALEAFERLLAGPFVDPKLRAIFWLIIGELERRAGRFESAHRRFTAVQNSPEYTEYRKIIDFQLKLIGEKDRSSHLIPD